LLYSDIKGFIWDFSGTRITTRS